MTPPSETPFAAAVLLAAGRSSRMQAGADAPRKPFLELLGRTVLEHALAAFAAARHVREVVLVLHPDDLARAGELLRGGPFEALVRARVGGGRERADSVRAGVAAVSPGARIVLVHDVARPCVRPERIDRVAEVALQHGAALLAVRVTDTIKTSRDGLESVGTLDRSILWAAQTPQGFELARFRELLAEAEREGVLPTDDAALWERGEGPVALVEGDLDNLKLTTPADQRLAEAVLSARPADGPPPR